jgi:hypothetical protein
MPTETENDSFNSLVLVTIYRVVNNKFYPGGCLKPNRVRGANLFSLPVPWPPVLCLKPVTGSGVEATSFGLIVKKPGSSLLSGRRELGLWVTIRPISITPRRASSRLALPPASCPSVRGILRRRFMLGWSPRQTLVRRCPMATAATFGRLASQSDRTRDPKLSSKLRCAPPRQNVPLRLKPQSAVRQRI